MNQKQEQILEFDQIKRQLAENAVCDKTRARLLALAPTMDEAEANRMLEETTHGRRIVETLGTPPLAAMRETNDLLNLAEKGAMLSTDQLTEVAVFLQTCRRMKGYLKRAEEFDDHISYYGRSLCDLDDLLDEINNSIRNGQVDSAASAQLREIRRKLENMASQIKAKLEGMLRGKKEWYADHYISKRGGRYVLPVKKEYKNQVNGMTVEVSGTGSTCFIEPAAVRRLQEEAAALEIAEDNEIRRILYTLSSLVADYGPGLRVNMEAMETLDFVFAKAKLSLQMKANPPKISMRKQIAIQQGRHPLLKQEAVPLDFCMGGRTRGIVITGPNTGGKTVALKTVGLLSLMAQSGLHVPAAEGSVFSMHRLILCDIGDGQSISENLSTFSSHILNVIDILRQTDPDCLVLLDELGSGTDPAEGMGIAVAVLEELHAKGCLFVVTTHYPEVKELAGRMEGLENARMAFDRESLQPLYRLEIGEAGESCALYIAKRLGLPSALLKRAYEAAYQPQAHTKTGGSYDMEKLTDAAGNKPALPAQAERPAGSVLKPQKRAPAAEPKGARFQQGDSVMIAPQGELGIVFAPADNQGDVIVQVKGVKKKINHKRLKLKAPASEMYPPDYDFSIVFDPVEARKKRRKMSKGHQPGMVVEVENDFL